MNFYPEGTQADLCRSFTSLKELRTAAANRDILEARVLRCDSAHNLILDLGCCQGIMPRTEGAYGILEGTLRDIALISKVNRTVCFRIIGFHRNEAGNLVPVLSRRNVQLEARADYLQQLVPGDIIPARVTRLESFGAFIDIGCGINSLIPIDMLSVSRINSPAERLQEGQIIHAVLRRREPEKLTFSLKELLGTWMENAAGFAAGETVSGIVRSVESYGIFVELAPNLAGLAEITQGIEVGARVSVFIKSILPQRMKIKLSIIETFAAETAPAPLPYFVHSRHIDRWHYSPPDADKHIVTVFNPI